MPYFFSLVVLVMFFVPSATKAMEFVLYENYNDMEQIDMDQEGTWYFGDLADFPHTYTFTIDEAQPASFTILVPARDVPEVLPGVLIVRQAARGVDEVARLKAKEMDWTEWRDGTTGDTYQKGGSYIAEWLEPGSYLLEVQTPTNNGKYALQVGNGAPTENIGYFAALTSLPALKRWHGKSAIMIVESRYVYVPLSIFIFLGLVGWWYRRKKHA